MKTRSDTQWPWTQDGMGDPQHHTFASREVKSSLPDRDKRAAALGKQLRIARERSGSSLTEAAIAIGGGHAAEYVQAIESGVEAPSLDQLYSLAALYGATVDVCVWPRPATNRRSP